MQTMCPEDERSQFIEKPPFYEINMLTDCVVTGHNFIDVYAI